MLILPLALVLLAPNPKGHISPGKISARSVRSIQAPRPSRILVVPGEYGTIQSAVDAARSGDTVLVAPGTYTSGTIMLREGVSLRSAAGAGRTTLRGVGDGPILLASQVTGCEVEGFTIESVGRAARAAVEATTAATVYVSRCVFSGTFDGSAPIPTAAVASQWYSTVIVSHCVFDAQGLPSPNPAGVAYYGGDLIVSNSLFTNHNTPAVLWKTGSDLKVINCTIAGNNAAAIDTGSPWHELYVYNSVLQENTGGALMLGEDGLKDGQEAYVTVSYSNLPGWDAGEGNIDAAPSFVDAANGDYRLAPGSAGIDAGSEAVLEDERLDRPLDNVFFVAPGRDLAGGGRVAGSAIDMGAYETASNP